MPPLAAEAVALLVKAPPASTRVPPATSAETVPLLVMDCPPLVSQYWLPMMPLWPRMVTPEPMVSTLPAPSTLRRLLVLLSNTTLPLPVSVWLP